MSLNAGKPPVVGANEVIGAKLKEEENVKVKDDGLFFDDFDAAFGSDNDVPILDLKKEEQPKKEATL